jgi:hypothetical protein
MVMKPEDLLVERVLVSVYPGENPTARKCARALAVVGLAGAVKINWSEVLRIANLPEYRNVNPCKVLVDEVANELKIANPFHSD